jgi:hypothetical protein
MQLCSSGGLSRSWGLGVPFRSLPQSCCFVSYQSDGETPQRVSVGGRPRQSSVFGDTDPTNGTGLPHHLHSGLRSPPRSRSRYRSDGCCAVLWLTRHFAAEANQFRDFGLPSTRAKAESGQRAIHKPARVPFELCQPALQLQLAPLLGQGRRMQDHSSCVSCIACAFCPTKCSLLRCTDGNHRRLHSVQPVCSRCIKIMITAASSILLAISPAPTRRTFRNWKPTHVRGS